MYAGKRILITGAGGFIGSALVAALTAAFPQFLVLLDNSERNLHEVETMLCPRNGFAYAAVLGDICDVALLAEILECYRPEVIFHAAACKHVPLMEQNPLAAMRTNALGTWRLLQTALQTSAQTLPRAAGASRVAQVLLISTDKSVKPASVMGATKRVAELALERMCSAEATLAGVTLPEVTLQTVRLGNVLGSHGSVQPLFAKQIARGGPVTVTHAEVERYFFNLNETMGIILGAAALESGTFIPVLPAPLKISELAQRMIREARPADSDEVSIEFTAMRPGDKLREDFLNDDEVAEATRDSRLQRVLRTKPDTQKPDTEKPDAQRPDAQKLDAQKLDAQRLDAQRLDAPNVDAPKLDPLHFDELMAQLADAVAQRQLGPAMRILRELVPGYRPSETLLETARQASVARA
jgi:FlaA1/EpsC-like NDP-sugar epimerase